MWPSTNGSNTEIITYQTTKNTELRNVNIPALDSFTSWIEEADDKEGSIAKYRLHSMSKRRRTNIPPNVLQGCFFIQLPFC